MKFLIINIRSIVFCVLVAIGLTSIHQTNAQTVPALVNYQGRLANPDGTALATGDYQLTFNVFASATNPSTASTNLIWGPQVFDGVAGQGHGGKIPVVQGYFNVMLGPVDTNGVSLANAFNATNRFVEIRVGTNSPILPRQQILSAPYALNSAKLAGADWSAVFGTNDPVNGKIPTSKLATNGVILAQQIGVGTASPSLKLDVAVAANSFDGARILGSDNHWISLYPSINSGGNNLLETSGDSALIFSQGPPGTGNLVIGPYSGAAAGIKIMSDGKVGIGTTSPLGPLHVKGGSQWGVFNWGSSLVVDGTRHNAIALLDAFSGNPIGICNESGTFSIARMPALGNTSQQPSYLLKILTNGNVGIGTTSPSYKLDVQGVIHTLDTTGGASFFAETRNANIAAKFAVQHPGGVGFGNGLTLQNLDPTINNVTGIVGENSGGAAVAGMEFVNVNHLGVGSRRGALSLFTINSNTTSRIYMSPEGNLGIGNSTPQAKLDVSGQINSDSIGFGGGTSINSTSVELGFPQSSSSTPYIDFHFGVGTSQDYNVRIINDSTRTLNVTALGGPASLRVEGAIVQTSDRNKKESIQPVLPAEILAKVAALPVSRWSYKGDGNTTHLGPMAQDFYAAFGLGTDDRHIAAIDSDGVALAAIQGLNHKLEEKLKEKDAQIDSLEKRLNELERITKSNGERN